MKRFATDSDNVAITNVTTGVGPGTFTHRFCESYAKHGWPTAVIEFPVKEGGKPIVATVRLAEE